MHVTLDHIETITPTIKTFWFKPERKVRYTAGQFTELHLPHEKPDDRGIRRWFTLSSSPTEELLAITTRIEAGRGSTFKQQLAALKPGAKLQLAEPMGDFVLPKDPNIPLVFVAAGLGITPVRSIVTWLRDTHQARTMHLLQVVSMASELAYKNLFSEYPLTYTPISKDQNTRAINAKMIANLAGESALIYLSGPENMVEALYKELIASGTKPERLVADYFPGYV